MNVPLFDLDGKYFDTVEVDKAATVIHWRGRTFIKYGDREYHQATVGRVIRSIANPQQVRWYQARTLEMANAKAAE